MLLSPAQGCRVALPGELSHTLGLLRWGTEQVGGVPQQESQLQWAATTSHPQCSQDCRTPNSHTNTRPLSLFPPQGWPGATRAVSAPGTWLLYSQKKCRTPTPSNGWVPESPSLAAAVTILSWLVSTQGQMTPAVGWSTARGGRMFENGV